MVLQAKSTPNPIFFQIAKNLPQYTIGLEQSKQKRRLLPPLETAFTGLSLASKTTLQLGELSCDSSGRFSRRKFFKFETENILLESLTR